MKKIIATFVFLLFGLTFFATAQKERNYIYVLDCTRSMTGFGGNPNIWNQTLQFLQEDIDSQDSDAHIVIVPFQNKPYHQITFDRSSFTPKMWTNDIRPKLDSLVKQAANTNICDAWTAAMSHVNTNKYNYVYLLTDGRDNVKGVAALCNLLSSWCGKYRDTHAFYVMLTKNAIDENIVQAVSGCEQIDLVKEAGTVFVGLDNKTLNINSHQLPALRMLSINSVRPINARVECADPYFSVQLENDAFKGGQGRVKVSLKVSYQQFNQAIGGNEHYAIQAQLIPTTAKVRCENPDFSIEVINKPERILTTKIEKGTKLNNASYYPSFLFWDETVLDTLNVDLEATFNKEAKTYKSAMRIKVASFNEHGEAMPDDYQLLFNGSPLQGNEFTISAEDSKSGLLQIVFNRDAATGKRYFKLSSAGASNLDRVNEVAPRDVEFTLSTKYSIDYNPLAVILFWTGVAFLTLLIVWFCMLKPLNFPKFKGVSFAVLQGVKGVSIFLNVPLKGYRKVVLTNQQQKQSAFSRIFTGRINYFVNEEFTSPIEIEPAKNAIHARFNHMAWTLTPSAKIAKYQEHELENLNTNSKFKVNVQ